MKTTFALAALASIAAFGAPAEAQSKLPPKLELADFTQTEAKSLDDYTGRLLLIEFFAYW